MGYGEECVDVFVGLEGILEGAEGLLTSCDQILCYLNLMLTLSTPTSNTNICKF